MQKLGQHFLKNKNVAAKIIDALALQAGDIVFEIGPGHGELTKELKKSAEGESPSGEKNKEIKIISIEKDENLCGLLKKQFKDGGKIEIICGDALVLLPTLISKYRNIPPRRGDVRPKGGETSKYKLVGNIPYYITGRLLRVISELNNKPERFVCMVQKEVALRITGRPAFGATDLPAHKSGCRNQERIGEAFRKAGNERRSARKMGGGMNRLAASVQFWAEPKIIADVPRNDFRPVPKVDSAVILLLQKEGPMPCNARGYYAAVRALFGQPRKTVLNNICEGIDIKKGKGQKKETVAAALENSGVNPECRPQNLSIPNIAAVAKIFFDG
jgi:16S rRNA (adenine1518-N6/adenine1519-N6)-dimethyltransferase